MILGITCPIPATSGRCSTTCWRMREAYRRSPSGSMGRRDCHMRRGQYWKASVSRGGPRDRSGRGRPCGIIARRRGPRIFNCTSGPLSGAGRRRRAFRSGRRRAKDIWRPSVSWFTCHLQRDVSEGLLSRSHPPHIRFRYTSGTLSRHASRGRHNTPFLSPSQTLRHPEMGLAPASSEFHLLIQRFPHGIATVYR